MSNEAKDVQCAERIGALEALHGPDREVSHSDADELLVELLRSLGYHRTVAAFERLDKWYA